MKDFFKGLNIWHCMLGVLLLSLLFKQDPAQKSPVVYVVDSSKISFTPQEHLKPSSVRPADINIIQKGMDSAAIVKLLNDYYSLKTYSDSLRDTNVVVYWNAAVLKNNLESHGLSYKILRPTSIIPPADPHRKIYTGLYASMMYPRADFGIGITYVGKNENSITVGINPVNRSGFVMASKLISLKKN